MTTITLLRYERARGAAMIYYDITDILEYAGRNVTLSGIQRFTVQLISETVNKFGAERVRILGYHPRWKQLAAFDASFFQGNYTYEQSAFCNYFSLHRAFFDVDTYIQNKYPTRIKKTLHRARLLIANKLSGGVTFAKRNIGNSPQPKFAHGDVVFICGATWGLNRYIPLLTQHRGENGLRIFHFIHDLIPLRTPEHVGDGVPEQFSNWVEHVSEYCDGFLTNSVASKLDLDAWLADHGKKIPTSVVRLAHQFGNSPRPKPGAIANDEGVRDFVRNAARLPYVLCVGTLETRKNNWTLAQVWQRVHAKLGYAAPRLIFAGKPGAFNHDFDDFIRGSGSLNGYIRVIERPSDIDLAYLYRRCLFSVFPSYVEGWGLPIGESLWFGRPVIASNTSSMPEVGGHLADYVDPHSPQSIEDAVIRMINDVTYREQRASEIAAAPLRSWGDVAGDLWSALAAADAARPVGSANLDRIRGPRKSNAEMAEQFSGERSRIPRIRPTWQKPRLGRIVSGDGALRLWRADKGAQTIRWEPIRPEECEFSFPDSEGPPKSDGKVLG